MHLSPKKGNIQPFWRILKKFHNSITSPWIEHIYFELKIRQNISRLIGE